MFKVFKTNSGLWYNQYVYFIIIEENVTNQILKNLQISRCLVIDTLNLDEEDYLIYKIGKLELFEKYEIEESNYDIKNSPLYNTFLFQHFLSSSKVKKWISLKK